MTAKFIQEGYHLDYVNGGGTLNRGDMVSLAGTRERVGIVVGESIANGATGAVATKGVFEFPKKTAADNLTAWSKCLIDAAGTVEADVAGTHLIVKAAGVGVTTVLVRINEF